MVLTESIRVGTMSASTTMSVVTSVGVSTSVWVSTSVLVGTPLSGVLFSTETFSGDLVGTVSDGTSLSGVLFSSCRIRLEKRVFTFH